MNNRILYAGIVLAAGMLFQASCEKPEDPETEPIATIGNHEDSTDYVWNSGEVVQVILAESGVSGPIKGASLSGKRLTITAAGTYNFTGSWPDGGITVNTADTDPVRLLLSGMSVTCSDGPAILVTDAKKVIIILTDSTENHLADGNSYSTAATDTDAPNAVLYSKEDLTIYGNGSLTVDGNYQDGITSKDGLILSGGRIQVTAVDDGIRGKDYLVAEGSSVTVKSGGDGIKSDNEDDATLGFITIASGVIAVTSGEDAISAESIVSIAEGQFKLTSGTGASSSGLSSKGIKAGELVRIDGGTFVVNSTDDALHSNGKLAINGGSFTLSTGDDGIHAETAVTINDGAVTIAKSVEGIESAEITVNKGTIRINATDDGFNATHGVRGEASDGSSLILNGGDIVVNASKGDGLDSNGNIVMTGGTVVVHGPQSQPEVGMDYNGSCTVSGGLLVISGTNSNMTQAIGTSSPQYGIRVLTNKSLAAGTVFHVEDADGSNILTFKPIRAYSSVIFSSAALKSGSTYSIYTGGASSGTDSNGIITGGTYSGGTLKKSFTISSKVTSISF